MKFIGIHGVPRSGTTWIGEILNSSPSTIYKYQPLFSYALKSAISESSTTDEIHQFLQSLTSIQDDFLDQTQARSDGRLPSFLKTATTHTVYKEVRYHNVVNNLLARCRLDIRLVLVIRNPLAVIHSWLNAPREFRADLGWSRLAEWQYAHKKNQARPEEFNGYEKWKEAATIFHDLAERCPDRVRILKYGDLLANPETTTRHLFRFLELRYEESTARFLRNSRTKEDNDAYSVFRSGDTDNKWREALEPQIVDHVTNDLWHSALKVYLE